MFFKSFMRCAICFTIIQNTICSPVADDIDLVRTSWTNDGADKIVGENVSISDSSSLTDKSENSRGFPASSEHDRSSDKRYQDIDYSDDNGISPALTPELPECILSRSEFYLSWWVNEDGSLKLPPTNRPGRSPGFADLSFKFTNEDGIFKHVSEMTSNNPNDVIAFMSIANNHLNNLPFETLSLLSISLQYLSLANNHFNDLFENHNESFQTWSSFPLMSNLKELDLRNCSLTRLEYDIFSSLHNLEKLFLSHNMFETISSITFSNLFHLSHLDLSYNSIEDFMPFNYDPFSFYLNGLMLEETVFENLTNLVFLDLSHTKLRQESVRALSMLQSKVEQLSLCYTEIPLIAPTMFSQTNLKVLDLSGNPGLIPNLVSTWFGGLELKLEILIFKDSNIKSLSALRNLKKLKMLDLGNNNVNKISLPNFMNFADLEILDLSGNHISNWYERVFESNRGLKIVNLRNNNINLITPEMMKDFSGTKYLAIGANSFVCDCTLREFIDRAAFNAMRYQCEARNRSRRSKRSEFPEQFNDPKYHYEVLFREFHFYVMHIDKSSKNIIGESLNEALAHETVPMTLTAKTDVQQANCDYVSDDTYPNSGMSFRFLLLDYSENDYHCVESDGSSKSKRFFSEIPICESYAQSSTEDAESEDITEEKIYGIQRTSQSLLVVYISVGIPLTVFIALWIWKRRDIRYFCAIFRNTLILSFDKEDDKAQSLMKNRRKSANNKSNEDDYRFDLFVSYSEKDRGFVLDQLIPNLEKRSEITICLHERDFQVGLGILENIIQCMDQSRCLLLVVSESFIKSNWCSFEMHLAQHRLIETRREQLILVLLEDIPKAKRPRTLTFLMRTKTYIMWPSEDKEELRSVFWKRLKKAIVLNNWEPEKGRTPKPRHSIV